MVEADYKSIEAILVGWYAGDPSYVRLAKMGVHAFLASHVLADLGKFDRLSTALSDEELRLALKEATKISKALTIPNGSDNYYGGCKVTVHMGNYLGTASYLAKLYPEIFPTKANAEKLQKMYFELFPAIPKWQNAVVDRAYWDSGVTSVFGYRRKFYNVKRWAFSNRTGKWEQVWSDDAKKAVATIPQGSAAAIIRRAMCSKAFAGLRAEECAMLQVHDSLLARARNDDQKEWVKVQLAEAMLTPIPEMGGLVIPIEIAAGPNWGQMKEE